MSLYPAPGTASEESGNLRIRLDLAPHPRNKHIHAAIEGIRATTRNGVPQLVTRYNLARTADQFFQQV